MEVSIYSNRNSGQIHLQHHQIPAFGDWDKAKDLPITQYFETARQAGLIRYSSSSGESGPCPPPSDLYSADRMKPPPLPTTVRKGRVREKRYPHVGLKEHHQIPIKKQQMMMMQQGGRVFDVTETGGARKLKQNDVSSISRPPPRSNLTTIPKPVDEDLYKIPPELLHSSKRNKMKGLFSRCLVPACN
ncbi:uncharacterized protein LOC101218053 [Cucumis sativus]|uniref:RIN4 pathogenic type III effector avirulence factor Avr cleavage site domain-containing protein n=1 Tax=Cucumis sativus TaxID=3659 RepID=A0A0A0LKP3_CUCSA|nr:uncharacterized protein LOC101218053 [Cucumis sativus]KGN61322.1 hypothetical protein Csa_006309 [Cucumis sativus]